jgi:tRNA (mo5U34)-methyltransferase
MSFTFGWPPVFDSLRLNDKPKTEHTQQPAGETLELIKSKLALDLELYQFGQTLFEQRFHAMTELLVKEYAGPVITDSDQPLRKEVLYELLQKHYEVRRNRRNQKLLKAIGPTYLYSPAEHTEGNFGWHTVEMSDVHGAMVWSGPGLESGFDLPCPRGENIQVSFCVLMTIKSDIIEKLALKVNGIPVTLQFQNDPQGAFVFTGRLPAKAISGSFLRLVFSVPYTLAPCDITLDNKDSRLLGFLLNWLKLEAQGEHAKRETMSQITNPEQIASLIQSVGFWYHQIELAPGITTPGMNASLKVLENLDSLGLPKEAKGLRVLDIGCRDGYFAFEMERRGAEVIGIDYAPSHTTGFDVAAKILDSKVPYILENVYNLIPETYGTFDIVLFLGVIYHLRNPLLALDKIRTVMKPEGLLFVESAIATDETIAALDIPVWRFYPNNSLNQDATNKWAPNMIGLQAVVEEAGFQIQRSLSGVARGYVKAQAIVDIQQQHFQQLDSSKGILGVKKI